jgi:hypothetical protein
MREIPTNMRQSQGCSWRNLRRKLSESIAAAKTEGIVASGRR